MPDGTGVLEGSHLPGEVADALVALGVEPASAVAVGGWRAGRMTYRITSADGRVVKARRLQGRIKPARAAALAAAVGDPCIPSPLTVAGRVTIEAWVEGTPLSEQRLCNAHVDSAADLLGRLHAHPAVPGFGTPGHRNVRVLVARVERQLDALTAAAALSRVDRGRLLEVVRDGLPDRAAWGLTHGDLCPSNLVITPAGGLVSVDNEGITFNFLDFDVARTWCRWPMPARSWTRFVRRYASWGRSAFELGSARAWYTAAAVKRAHRWHRTRQSDPDVTRALRRVLEGV
jgi:aminoglycoside phosphotransferase (APT) family kinase protein